MGFGRLLCGIAVTRPPERESYVEQKEDEHRKIEQHKYAETDDTGDDAESCHDDILASVTT